MIVFDRQGNFIRSFGERLFPRAHGVFMAPDDTIWLTDDGDHTPPQTVHVAFMSLKPLFFTVRGNMEKESHGEEKEKEREIEDLKRASLALGQRYQSFGSNYAWRLNEVQPLLL
jgi:hypothetical protein